VIVVAAREKWLRIAASFNPQPQEAAELEGYQFSTRAAARSR